MWWAVKFSYEKSEEFQTTTGLKQGDALSPILLEMAVKEVQDEYQGINWPKPSITSICRRHGNIRWK